MEGYALFFKGIERLPEPKAFSEDLPDCTCYYRVFTSFYSTVTKEWLAETYEGPLHLREEIQPGDYSAKCNDFVFFITENDKESILVFEIVFTAVDKFGRIIRELSLGWSFLDLMALTVDVPDVNELDKGEIDIPTITREISKGTPRIFVVLPDFVGNMERTNNYEEAQLELILLKHEELLHIETLIPHHQCVDERNSSYSIAGLFPAQIQTAILSSFQNEITKYSQRFSSDLPAEEPQKKKGKKKGKDKKRNNENVFNEMTSDLNRRRLERFLQIVNEDEDEKRERKKTQKKSKKKRKNKKNSKQTEENPEENDQPDESQNEESDNDNQLSDSEEDQSSSAPEDSDSNEDEQVEALNVEKETYKWLDSSFWEEVDFEIIQGKPVPREMKHEEARERILLFTNKRTLSAGAPPSKQPLFPLGYRTTRGVIIRNMWKYGNALLHPIRQEPMTMNLKNIYIRLQDRFEEVLRAQLNYIRRREQMTDDDQKTVDVVRRKLLVIPTNGVKAISTHTEYPLLLDKPTNVTKGHGKTKKVFRYEVLRMEKKQTTISIPNCFAHPNFCLVFMVVYDVKVPIFYTNEGQKNWDPKYFPKSKKPVKPLGIILPEETEKQVVIGWNDFYPFRCAIEPVKEEEEELDDSFSDSDSMDEDEKRKWKEQIQRDNLDKAKLKVRSRVFLRIPKLEKTEDLSKDEPKKKKEKKKKDKKKKGEDEEESSSAESGKTSEKSKKKDKKTEKATEIPLRANDLINCLYQDITGTWTFDPRRGPFSGVRGGIDKKDMSVDITEFQRNQFDLIEDDEAKERKSKKKKKQPQIAPKIPRLEVLFPFAVLHPYTLPVYLVGPYNTPLGRNTVISEPFVRIRFNLVIDKNEESLIPIYLLPPWQENEIRRYRHRRRKPKSKRKKEKTQVEELDEEEEQKEESEKEQDVPELRVKCRLKNFTIPQPPTIIVHRPSHIASSTVFSTASSYQFSFAFVSFTPIEPLADETWQANQNDKIKKERSKGGEEEEQDETPQTEEVVEEGLSEEGRSYYLQHQSRKIASFLPKTVSFSVRFFNAQSTTSLPSHISIMESSGNEDEDEEGDQPARHEDGMIRISPIGANSETDATTIDVTIDPNTVFSLPPAFPPISTPTNSAFTSPSLSFSSTFASYLSSHHVLQFDIWDEENTKLPVAVAFLPLWNVGAGIGLDVDTANLVGEGAGERSHENLRQSSKMSFNLDVFPAFVLLSHEDGKRSGSDFGGSVAPPGSQLSSFFYPYHPFQHPHPTPIAKLNVIIDFQQQSIVSGSIEEQLEVPPSHPTAVQTRSASARMASPSRREQSPTMHPYQSPSKFTQSGRNSLSPSRMMTTNLVHSSLSTGRNEDIKTPASRSLMKKSLLENIAKQTVTTSFPIFPSFASPTYFSVPFSNNSPSARRIDILIDDSERFGKVSLPSTSALKKVFGVNNESDLVELFVIVDQSVGKQYRSILSVNENDSESGDAQNDDGSPVFFQPPRGTVGAIPSRPIHFVQPYSIQSTLFSGAAGKGRRSDAEVKESSFEYTYSLELPPHSTTNIQFLFHSFNAGFVSTNPIGQSSSSSKSYAAPTTSDSPPIIARSIRVSLRDSLSHSSLSSFNVVVCPSSYSPDRTIHVYKAAGEECSLSLPIPSTNCVALCTDDARQLSDQQRFEEHDDNEDENAPAQNKPQKPQTQNKIQNVVKEVVISNSCGGVISSALIQSRSGSSFSFGFGRSGSVQSGQSYSNQLQLQLTLDDSFLFAGSSNAMNASSTAGRTQTISTDLSMLTVGTSQSTRKQVPSFDSDSYSAFAPFKISVAMYNDRHCVSLFEIWDVIVTVLPRISLGSTQTSSITNPATKQTKSCRVGTSFPITTCLSYPAPVTASSFSGQAITSHRLHFSSPSQWDSNSPTIALFPRLSQIQHPPSDTKTKSTMLVQPLVVSAIGAGNSAVQTGSVLGLGQEGRKRLSIAHPWYGGTTVLSVFDETTNSVRRRWIVTTPGEESVPKEPQPSQPQQETQNLVKESRILACFGPKLTMKCSLHADYGCLGMITIPFSNPFDGTKDFSITSTHPHLLFPLTPSFTLTNFSSLHIPLSVEPHFELQQNVLVGISGQLDNSDPAPSTQPPLASQAQLVQNAPNRAGQTKMESHMIFVSIVASGAIDDQCEQFIQICLTYHNAYSPYIPPRVKGETKGEDVSYKTTGISFHVDWEAPPH
ncbi:putative DNA-directed RNA polymerase I subunit RPA43 [Blattamonas nauphoetae]|uniref:DNA-directed RNA polymerase I subunit RPA43 n=1 Tax=Blattamonas nauphoetae TaxID=2049346 RepID=A0ABQ9XIT2_9EUKA|nr:putative DNA-directed RNA polymerase I subunit RPA43 [Blattamonas nauphoetae]